MIINDFQDNYGTGWIKLYRSIKEHWIWQDPVKFQWWIDILISVNHSGKTINIGYDIYDCKPGQSIRSLKNWADNWNVSKDTVRNFFTLLKKDKMIFTENLKKTTRLTVCNYETYQDVLHVKQTTSKRKANDKQTQGDPNKNDKNDKNEKNEKNNIPTFEIFKTYALENESTLNIQALKLKYESWKINNWKDGYDKPIKNWKSKLLNTIPHLPKDNDNGKVKEYYKPPAKLL